MDLVHLDVLAGSAVLVALHFGEEFLAEFVAAGFDLVLINAVDGVSRWVVGGR